MRVGPALGDSDSQRRMRRRSGVFREADHRHRGLTRREHRDPVAPGLLGEAVHEQAADPLDLSDGVGALQAPRGGQRGREGAARERR